jgi:4-amino-4-deoxy-L-arabinose transferase-like glycosyltransferase
VYAVLVALYVLLFPYHPGLRSPNELCRLWQTRALVEYGTLDINRALQDFGYVGDLSVKDGKYYPSKAPLLSFAAVPVYAALRWWGGGFLHAVPEVPLVFFSRLFLTVLPTLVLLWLVRRFLGAYLSSSVADAVTVTYGLGSLAFSYSLLFMSHQTTAVLLFGGFYALWRLARGEWRERGYLVAGACAGATVSAEYTGALGVLGLVLYAVLSVPGREEPLRARWVRLGRGAALATLGALPFVVGLMLYHHAAFGHPLESGYEYLNDAAYQPWHLGGFLGIRYPDPRAFALSFFSPLRGLFTLSPFLLLALPGAAVLWREARAHVEMRAHLWLVVALLAGYTYFTSSFSYDSWGWTTGPRHLTGLVPFLLLPVGLLLERLRASGRLGFVGAAAALCTASILFTGLATFVNYVPDDVSNAVLGLAVPLLRAGYLPPSLLNVLGVSNPLAGGLLLALLLGLATWVLARLVTPESQRPGPLPLLAGLAVLALLLGVQATTVKHHAADQGAVRFLQSVWLVPPGRLLDF